MSFQYRSLLTSVCVQIYWTTQRKSCAFSYRTSQVGFCFVFSPHSGFKRNQKSNRLDWYCVQPAFSWPLHLCRWQLSKQMDHNRSCVTAPPPATLAVKAMMSSYWPLKPSWLLVSSLLQAILWDQPVERRRGFFFPQVRCFHGHFCYHVCDILGIMQNAANSAYGWECKNCRWSLEHEPCRRCMCWPQVDTHLPAWPRPPPLPPWSISVDSWLRLPPSNRFVSVWERDKVINDFQLTLNTAEWLSPFPAAIPVMSHHGKRFYSHPGKTLKSIFVAFFKKNIYNSKCSSWVSQRFSV